jgi:endoglucanase
VNNRFLLTIAITLVAFAAMALVAWGFTSSAGPAFERDLPAAACDAAGRSDVPSEVRQMVARGFNLPGWTDEWPPRAPDESLLARLRAAGLTHVRLPIRAEMLSERFAGSPILPTQSLRQIDQAVSTLLRLNYAVSIDMHSGSGFGALLAKRPEEALAALKEVWTTIAARYAWTPPDRVLFEVLNEPDVPANIWN